MSYKNWMLCLGFSTVMSILIGVEHNFNYISDFYEWTDPLEVIFIICIMLGSIIALYLEGNIEDLQEEFSHIAAVSASSILLFSVVSTILTSFRGGVSLGFIMGCGYFIFSLASFAIISLLIAFFKAISKKEEV